MSRIRKPARSPRGAPDLAQLRLFAEVDAVLADSALRIADEHAAQPRVSAQPQTAPEPTTEPTPQVLALAVADARARQSALELEAGRDEATRRIRARAVNLHAVAERSCQAAVQALRDAQATGDPATAGMLRAAVEEHQRRLRTTRAHLRDAVPFYRMQAISGQVYADYLDTLERQQDALDAGYREVTERSAALADRLEIDRPGYLPTLAADATRAQRRRWRERAVAIEVYRARHGVTGHTHPLGVRPIDLSQAAEYDRTAAALGLAGTRPGRQREVSRDMPHEL